MIRERLDRRNIYKMAVDKWGVGSQLDMLVEECSELITAINHAKRARAVTCRGTR